MFCSNCGKSNPDSAGFCAQCGNRLGMAADGNPVVNVPVSAVSGIYAGFWKRFVALILDYVILALPNLVMESYAFSILIAWVYFALMESSHMQATLGKMALGIKVVDRQGNRISFARASGRFFGKILSGMILCAGYILAAFTARKQALHDLLADCLVINRSATSEELSRPVPADSSTVIVIVLVVAVALAIPVIGIVAAVAIPTFQGYAMKAKLYEVVSVGKQATQAVDNYVAMNDVFPSSMQDTDFSNSSPLVEAVRLVGGGSIRLDLNVPSLENGAVIFTFNNGSGWQCRGEEIPEKYLPASCQ